MEPQHRLPRGVATASVALIALALSCAVSAQSQAARAELRRGEYLVKYGGCNDCHSPKNMTPQGAVPDPARLLSGYTGDGQLPALPAGALSPNGWIAATNGDLTAWVGPWGTSFAANLTPDAETGLGKWTAQDFIKTMRTGKHLGAGRPILPPMPWYDVAVLTDADLRAVFAYLRTVKPIRNPVPPPLPPK